MSRRAATAGLSIRRPELTTALVAVALTVGLLLGSPSQSAAQVPGLSGEVVPGGSSLVVWGGGPPGDLAGAAGQQGCVAASVWGTADGQFVVYVFGAPDIVNQAFLNLFAGGTIPGGTALVLACGAGAPSASSAATNTQPASLEQQFGTAVFNAINAARTSNGRAVLQPDGRLRSAAEQYVRLLLARGEIGHSFDGQPWDRAQRAGYPSSIVGEVVASRGTSEALDVTDDTAVLMQGWFNSQSHRDIILGRDFAFTDLGVGCATGRDRGGLNTVVCVAMAGQR